MAERLSTGLRNAILGKKATVPTIVVGSTISFGDGTGTGGRDTIVDSGAALGNFVKRSIITVKGSASNDGSYEVLSVTAGTIEVAAGSFSTESSGATVVLAQPQGGSLSGILRNGVISLYSGTQPASADDAETGTLLGNISLSSGAFVGGSQTYGINFDVAATGVLAKDVDEVWSGTAVATGVAGWFRFYDNTKTTGLSATAVRLDGAIATSGSELNMANTSVTLNGSITVDTFTVTLPAS